MLILARTVKNAFAKYWFIYRLPEVFIVVVVSTSTLVALTQIVCTPQLTPPRTVLSDEFDWDQDGVEILGSVPINTGGSFVAFPLTARTMRYLRRTPSTAV